MKRYDSYKDSGVEWIGKVPSDWQVYRLKKCLQERKEKNDPIKTDFILSLTNTKGVIPYSEKGDLGNKAKGDPSGYNLAYPGDIVLNSMNVVIGSVGLSNYFGAVSPVYYMLYPRSEKDDVRYYNYIFQMSEFQYALKGLGNGILEIRMRIPMNKLNNVLIPLPSSEEQQMISNYLDKKTSQIDSLIDKNEKSIELLEEYRKSIISEAVTKGLDPNAPMKDSGVEWIGEIPEGWSIGHLSYFVKSITDLDHYMPESVDLGIPYLMIGDLEDRASKIKFDKCKQISKEDFQRLAKKSRPSVGDLIVARYATIGTSCIVDIDREFLVTYGCLTVTPDLSNLTSEYLFYYMKSDVFLTDLSLQSNSNTQANVGKESLKYSTIIVPSTDEQQRVVLYLDEKTSQIDSLIDKKKQLIEKLTQYRKSLISECVTGKIKVPGVE